MYHTDESREGARLYAIDGVNLLFTKFLLLFNICLIGGCFPIKATAVRLSPDRRPYRHSFEILIGRSLE